MKTIQIPGVSFPVTQFCLGCAYLGSRESEEEAFAQMDYVYSQGGRFFNTAHEYGFGKSERTLGKWVRTRGVRHEVIVTSKGGEDHNAPMARAMRRADLLEDIDETLERLGFDYLDLYMMHLDDEKVPVEEILSTLHDIQKAGKIRHYGCSNWSVERQEAAAAFCAANGMEGFLIDENEHNLFHRNNPNHGSGTKWVDDEYIEHYRRTGIAVGAYSPTASGCVAKFLRDGSWENWDQYRKRAYVNDYNLDIIRRVIKLSEETGYTSTQIQLAWLMEQPLGFPCFTIAGASRLSQLEDALGCFNVRLTPDMIAYLRPEN